MLELADPLTSTGRATARLEGIERLHAQRNWLDLQLRQELAALATDDLPGYRKYVGDVVALHLAESPRTASRWVDDAVLLMAFPAVLAVVASGRWSNRHADAFIDEVTGLGLEPEQQEQVLELVLSRESARTPWEVRQATRAAVLVVDPGGAVRRYEKARAGAAVGVDVHGNGAGTFWATGTVSEVEMLWAAVDASTGPKEPGDSRALSIYLPEPEPYRSGAAGPAWGLTAFAVLVALQAALALSRARRSTRSGSRSTPTGA